MYVAIYVKKRRKIAIRFQPCFNFDFSYFKKVYAELQLLVRPPNFLIKNSGGSQNIVRLIRIKNLST